MGLLSRRKLTVILLLLYWPAIFIVTHIPIPRTILEYIRTSDKTLHYLAYLILVFLLWFAINPNNKVDWRKAPVWWVLFVVAWYGAIDEWLQGYVGRSPDVRDFLADLAGAGTGLILLSIFAFWPASLILIGSGIFILTNYMRVDVAEQLPLANVAFNLGAYAFFALLWMRYMHHLLPVRAPQLRWLIGALALPISFLLSIELFSIIAGNDFRLLDVIISLAAIIMTVGGFFFTALLYRKSTGQVSLD